MADPVRSRRAVVAIEFFIALVVSDLGGERSEAARGVFVSAVQMNSLFNLVAGWCAFVAGAASGAGLGLFFSRPEFLGGYDSWRRRLLRLGHIACFGMGMLNVLYALSVRAWPIPLAYEAWASTAWLLALVTMPVCCALAAWRQPLRHLFPIPVAATFVAIGAVLAGWWTNLTHCV